MDTLTPEERSNRLDSAKRLVCRERIAMTDVVDIANLLQSGISRRIRLTFGSYKSDWQCRTVKALTAAILLFAPNIAWAGPGDTLYAQGNLANVRSAPSKSASVVMAVGRGHKLIEFERKYGWVHVRIVRTGGKDGWIFNELVAAEFAGGESVATADQRFANFKNTIFDLNERVRQATGVDFFTKIENLGDGLVWVTATNVWVEAPYSDRESNLNKLFDLWDAAEGSGLPIMVQVVDQRGILVMRKARR